MEGKSYLWITAADEPIRVPLPITAMAVETGNTAECWPEQILPGKDAAPDSRTAETTGGRQVRVFDMDGFPVFGEDFPECVLFGVANEKGLR
ncbi:hypothetical protein OK351_07390 [Glutamicibacter sp. MNS18]|uniref:hypothetical protein n=1 Tax=Glutamicibacter sp. MNS18 TaxID=2989817 RepID=UPI00223663B6|nr:hypothetical protein [Glutamicibacter sp. MNS18]MCW4465322.1 hypothetical protein [Glutamicibacter sp. MNS18]